MAQTTTTPTIGECLFEACIVSEMLQGIDLMCNEGTTFDEARIATTIAAKDRAQKLYDMLSTIDLREATA